VGWILYWQLIGADSAQAIFGGGYKGGAMAIMKNLIRKYGSRTEL